MSSNPAQPAPQAPATDATPSVRPSSPSISLNDRVSTLITDTAPARVLESVIKTLADKEIDKRATALLGGLNLANETRSALKKAQEPDVRPTAFTLAGAPIGEVGYSKAKLGEQKKLTEKLAKIDKAIEAATRDANPDFGPLYNLKGEIEKAEKQAAEISAE